MTIQIIRRDQGDTAVAITTQLLVGGSPYAAMPSSPSVTAIVAGTVGTGAAATYQRFVLAGTWTTASAAAASVSFPLSPSGATQNPCASAANLRFEVRAVDSSGLVTQWPSDAPIPFIVRAKL